MSRWWHKFTREPKSWGWRAFRKGVRLQRTVVVGVGVFGGGYTLGQLELIDDPEDFSKKMLRNVLRQIGAEAIVFVREKEWLEGGVIGASKEQIRAGVKCRTATAVDLRGFLSGKDEIRPDVALEPDGPMWATAVRTQRVFERTKAAALALVIEQYDETKRFEQAAHSAASDGNAAVEETTVVKRTTSSVALASMNQAQLKRARRMLRRDWSIVVTSLDLPNAFVHSFVPRVVFVNVGLRHICKSDDELAALLGHEMSHAILRHGELAIRKNTLFSALALAVLTTLDPTGAVSFLLELAIGSKLLRGGLAASFSRTHEREADELGLNIAAAACYDPSESLNHFANMLAHETEMRGGKARTRSIMDTHPVTSERVTAAQSAAESLHSVHQHQHCQHVAGIYGNSGDRRSSCPSE